MDAGVSGLTTPGHPPLFALIREDWHAHGRDWTKPGFRALAVHRFGTWRAALPSRLLRGMFKPLYNWAFRRCRNLYGIELPWSAAIGRGVVIEHQGGIVVHGASVIGNRCVIRQNCTLGLRRLDDLTAAPVLEDGVQLGAGSVLLGRICIGRNALIGANAVVLADVPADAIATGIPARVVRSGDGREPRLAALDETRAHPDQDERVKTRR